MEWVQSEGLRLFFVKVYTIAGGIHHGASRICSRVASALPAVPPCFYIYATMLSLAKRGIDSNFNYNSSYVQAEYQYLNENKGN
jgi:hypothetical protein